MTLKDIAAVALDELDIEETQYWDDEDDSSFEDPVQYVLSESKSESAKKGKGNKKQKGEAEDASVFSFALDEIIKEEKKPKKDKVVTFKFKVKINASKFARRLGVEIPDDSSDALDTGLRTVFSNGTMDAATVSHEPRALTRVANSPWGRPQTETPLEDCRAQNPMTCRFHGAQAISNEIESSVRQSFQAAGREFGGNVNVHIDDVRRGVLSCTISVSSPLGDRGIVEQAMRQFGQIPGVSDLEYYDYDVEEGKTENSYDLDFDRLDQNARSRWFGSARSHSDSQGGVQETTQAEQQEQAATEEESAPAETEAAPNANGTPAELLQAQQNLAFAQMMLANAPEGMRPMIQAMVDAQQRIVDQLTPPAHPVESNNETGSTLGTRIMRQLMADAREQGMEEPRTGGTSSDDNENQETPQEADEQAEGGISDLDGAVRAAFETNGNGMSAAGYRMAIQDAISGDDDARQRAIRSLTRRLGEGHPVLGWIESQRTNAQGSETAAEERVTPDRPTENSLRRSFGENREMSNFREGEHGELSFNLPGTMTQDEVNAVVAQLQQQYGDGYQVTAERNGRGGYDFRMAPSISRENADSFRRGLEMTGLRLGGHEITGDHGNYSMSVGANDVVSYTNSLRERMPDAVVEPVQDANGNWTIRITPRLQETDVGQENGHGQREYTEEEHELRQTLTNAVHQQAEETQSQQNQSEESARAEQQDVNADVTNALDRLSSAWNEASRDRIFRGINDAMNGNPNPDVDAYLGEATEILGEDNPVIRAIRNRINGSNTEASAAGNETPSRAERELTEARMREAQQSTMPEEARNPIHNQETAAEQTEHVERNNGHDYNAWLNSRLGPENAGTVASLSDGELEGIVNGSAGEGNSSLLTPESAAVELAMRALAARYNGMNFDDNEAGDLIANAIGGNRGAQNVLRRYIGDERYNQLMRTSDTHSAHNSQQSAPAHPSQTPVVASTEGQRAVAEAQAREAAPRFVSARPVATPYSAAQDQSPKREAAISDEIKNDLISEYNRAKGEKHRLGQLLVEQGITTTGRNGEQVPDFNNRESGAAMKARRYASYLSAIGKVIGGYSRRQNAASVRRHRRDESQPITYDVTEAGNQLGNVNNAGSMVERMQSVMTDAFNAARENALGQNSTQYKRTKDALRYLGSKIGANVTVDDSNGNLNVEWTDHPDNETFDYGYIDEGRTSSQAREARTAASAQTQATEQNGGSSANATPDATVSQSSARQTQTSASGAQAATTPITEPPNQGVNNAAAQSLAQSVANAQNPMVRDILSRIQARAAGQNN